MNLLIITQKVDIDDDILGFFHDWITEFAKNFQQVIVICLEERKYSLPFNVKILSLGKEKKASKFTYLLNFYKYIYRERRNYDAVFVHMNAEYVVLSGWLWKILGKKIGLWYAHGSVPRSLRIAKKFCDVILTSTKSGCRIESPKIRIIGQGIDIEKFRPETTSSGKFKIITLGRLSPVKDYETFIEAIDLLVNQHKLEFAAQIIGGPATNDDRKYFEKLKEIVRVKDLEWAIEFKGSVPHKEVEKYICQANLMVNSSLTGSLDKTIVEAMACGVPILSCNEAFVEILDEEDYDLSVYRKGDSKQLAEKMKKIVELNQDVRKKIGAKLRKIVVKNHSLQLLIGKISFIFKVFEG